MIAGVNARQRDILLYLLQRGGAPVTAREIATRFGVAVRTVRYDLDYLRTALNGTGLRLVARPRAGLWIEGEPDRREAIIKLLRSVGEPPPLHWADRQNRLVVELLTCDEGLTIAELGDILACSRTTIQRDLEKIEPRLGQYGLRLERVRGRIRIAGSEQDRRETLVRFLVATVGPEELLRLSRGTGAVPPAAAAWPSGAAVGWEALSGVVRRAEQRLQRKFTEESFVSLVIHLSVALHRLGAGQEITMPPDRLAELKQLPEWPVAEAMAAELEALSGHPIPDPERGYMTLHLLGGRAQPLMPLSEMPPQAPEDPAARALAEQLIRQVSELLEVDLTDDPVLRRGLAWHLQGLLARQRFALGAINPLRAEIQEQMAPVYSAVARALRSVRDRLERDLSDDEIGFLTVHVAAALERRGEPAGVRVLVVCSTGLGSAHLLAARLKRQFEHLQIVGVVSALETGDAKWQHQVDLVITTVPLPPLPVPQVRVSPLLTPQEVERVRSAVRALAGADPRRPAAAEGHPLVDGVLAVIEPHVEVRDRDGLRRALEEYLVEQRPPLELAEPVIRELALLGIQVDPATHAGLAIHLQMALPRYRAGQVVAEPDLDRIRREHPSVFRAVERGLQILGRWHGVTIPPEEVVPVLRYVIRADKEDDGR